MNEREVPLLSVDNLSFNSSMGNRLLTEISFSVPRSSLTLLCGPNGSGKSVLMRIVKGLLQPTSGSIYVDGEDVTKKRKKRMQSIGLVFQDSETQIVGQTVEKDIRFGMENLRLGSEEQSRRLNEIASLLELTQHLSRRPKTLSGGEKRKLSIAGVLVMQPHLLILDEPFANLDWRGTVTVLQTLVRLREEGHTILLVSHEVEKVLAHVDHALILDEGALVAEGKSNEIYPLLRNHGIYVPDAAPIEELSWLKP